MKRLLLSEYDEKDVIQAVDTTENEGNSISTIEQYITEWEAQGQPWVKFWIKFWKP